MFLRKLRSKNRNQKKVNNVTDVLGDWMSSKFKLKSGKAML